MKILPLLTIIILIACIQLPIPTWAQAKKGEIKGKVTDSATKKPLPFATVAIYQAQDTALVTFRISDDKGLFRANGLPVQVKLRMLISMTGMAVYRREFTLNPEAPILDVGEIIMQPSENLLKEILIQAEIPPVIVRQDTLEFNASSFKTLPTALLEDLLKKMPGVQVDINGNITVNGRGVNRILVEGKEFFGNDIKVATRNLPADVIDKVQVMNDPDVVRENPLILPDRIPQVINLKFKKAIRQGAFGKVYAGGGNQERYEAGGILNMFRDTTQLSLIGYSNNLNRAGFGYGDLSQMGGFNRSGLDFSDVNGLTASGSSVGRQVSSGGGANYNTLLGSKTSVNLLYFAGNSQLRLNQLTNSAQTLNPSTTIDTRRSRNQFSVGNQHRVGGKLEWKPNASWFLQIRPGVLINDSRLNQDIFTLTQRNQATLINQSDNNEELDNGSLGYNAALSLIKKYSKNNRQFNFKGNYNINDAQNNQYNLATNIFYEPAAETNHLDQLRRNTRANRSIGHSLLYTESFFKDFYFAVFATSDFVNDRNQVRTYNYASDLDNYTSPVPDLSDFLYRQVWKHYASPGFQWRFPKQKITLTTGIGGYALHFRNNYEKSPDVNRAFYYGMKNMTIRWKDLTLGYNENIQEPNALDMQLVQNNTNPLFITMGNAQLRPTRDNSLELRYFKYIQKSQLSLNASITNNRYQDYVIRERTINAEGVQTSRPVNVNGVQHNSVSSGFSKGFRFNNKNRFVIGSSLIMGYNKSLVLLNEVESRQTILSIRPNINGRINLADKLELNQSFGLGRQNSFYRSDQFQNLSVNNRSAQTTLMYRPTRRLVWDAALNHTAYSNAAYGIQDQVTQLNAGVTYQFWKNNQGSLKLTAFDLLNQNNNVSRLIRENLIEDVQTNVLTRYLLLTFNYNIRNLGLKGTNDALLKF